MPTWAKVLKCATQDGVPTMWVEKPVGVKTCKMRHFQVYGTGWVIDENAKMVYIDTVFHGPYVWHVYELVDDPVK